MAIITKWRDKRITFNHLRQGRNKTLRQEFAEQLWYPKYTLFKTEHGKTEEDLGFHTIHASAQSQGYYSPHSSAKIKLTHLGKDSDLMVRQFYNAEIVCEFVNIIDYPFSVNFF